MLKHQKVKTSDGSHTIFLPEWNESYHSKHGAVQEALHVFIKMGLNEHPKKQLNVLEMGFGTGLNALLTAIHKRDKTIQYFGVEKYPLPYDEVMEMNYATESGEEKAKIYFEKMHQSPWEKEVQVDEGFSLIKIEMDFKRLAAVEFPPLDLFYFDCFGPRVQPELWTENVFKMLFEKAAPDALLVTYSAKGSVRRGMQAVGWEVERLPGPPGKREMLRAKKK